MARAKVEDAEKALAAAPPDSPERVDALVELAWSVWMTDVDRAQELNDEAMALAERLDYGRGLAYARRNAGLFDYGRADIEQALTRLNDAFEWFAEHGDEAGLADVHVALSYVFWSFGDFAKGLDHANKGLALYRNLDDLEGQGWALRALGGFHYDWKEHERAAAYFREAAGIFEKVGNDSGMGRALNGLGNVEMLLGNHEKALAYQRESLACYERADNPFSAAKSLNDIGLIYRSMGDLDEALTYHRQSLETRRKAGYIQGETTCLLDISDILLEKREYDETRAMLNRAVVLCEKIQAKPKLARAHMLLSQLYRDLGEFDVSLVHYESYTRIREEMFSEDTENKLKNIRIAHEIEASAREAEIYRLKNVELADKNKQLEETLGQLQTAQAQLVQSGKMAALGTLVAGLAHEINSPIGAIKSASDVSARAVAKAFDLVEDEAVAEKSSELRKILELIGANSENTSAGTERIETLVRSLRSFARLDEAEFQRADLHDGIDSTLTLVEHEIGDAIDVVKQYGDLSPVYCYPGELNQVFMNLILNAVQAMRDGGRLTISTSRRDGQAIVAVSDTGKGIPPEKIETLFEPSFTTRNASVRLRTGLYASYNIVEKHRGKLTVQSTVGEGSTFTVMIPERLDELLRAPAAG